MGARRVIEEAPAQRASPFQEKSWNERVSRSIFEQLLEV